MKIEVLDITKNSSQLIERCARACYNSDPNPDTRSKFLQGLVKSGHESPIEHAKLTVEISDVSRAFTHQLVRHRLMSFSQASQRYIRFSGDIDNFIVPDDILENDKAKQVYGKALSTIMDGYNKLCELGIKREDARMLLPNSSETKIITTANFREWRHFFEVRCDKHAQWEIRRFALSLLHWLATNDDTKDIFIDQAEKFFADLPEDFEISPVEV